MVELDIRRCASGELVVAHNPLANIDIDGVDQVDEFTAPERTALDAHDGEGVQTLDTVLDAIPTDVGVTLELKDPQITEQTLTVAESIPHEVIISSFNPNALHGGHPDENTNVDLTYVPGTTPDDTLAIATNPNCTYVHPNAWLSLLTSVVANPHDAELAVNAWTADSRPDAWTLPQRAIDGLIASSPHVTDWIE